MSSGEQMEPLIRFGVFEIDLKSGELRKHGLRVKLRDQSFQVLTLLLERPGQVVTREELQRKLWGADTFVDFDRGLNKAITLFGAWRRCLDIKRSEELAVISWCLQSTT